MKVERYSHPNHPPDNHPMLDLGGIMVCNCICPLCMDVDEQCICPDCRGHWPTDGQPVTMEVA